MESVKNSFDPSKKYKWQPNTNFEVTGAEFGVMLNAFRLALSTETAQQTLLIYEASKTAESVLARAVEIGIVEEADEQIDN